MHFDSAKSYVVLKRVRACRELYAVEFWVFRGPQLKVCCAKFECGSPVRMHIGRGVQPGFRDGDANRRTWRGAFDMHPAVDLGPVVSIKMQIEVVNELLGDFNEGDIACQAAVIPPVRLKIGDAVLMPGIVHRDHDEIRSGLNCTGDLAVERSESALMLANFPGVDPNNGVVIGGADVKEDACVRFWLVLEISLVPQQPFIIVERWALRIPVARDAQRWRFVEIIFHERTVGQVVAVHKKAVRTVLSVESVKTRAIGIHDSVPISVEADRGAVIHVGQQGGSRRLGKGAAGQRRRANKQESQRAMQSEVPPRWKT